MMSAGVIGVVLCGGESRRMGEDKARLQVGLRPLVEHAVSALDGVCEEVVLACGGSSNYEELGLQLVLDTAAGRGPLEGIASAMEVTGAERVLVLACDLPRVTAELPMALLERALQDDLDVCFLESRRGREPLIAAYSRAALPAMRAALSSGLRRVDSFYGLAVDGASLKVGALDERVLTEELRSSDVARNLNTPADLKEERQLLEEVVT